MLSKDCPAYCSNATQSRALARKIEQYWRIRGHNVNVWVERDTISSRKPLYIIRSNIKLRV